MSANYLLAHASASHSDAVWSVKWTRPTSKHPDGLVVSAGGDKSVRTWNPAQPGEPLEVLLPAPRQKALGLVSIDTGGDDSGDFVVSASLDSVICRWALGVESDLQGRAVMGPAETFTLALNPISQSAVVAATGADAKVHVLDGSAGAKFGTKLASMNGRGKFGMTISYSPDGRLLAAASDSGQVSLYDAETHQLLSSFAAHATTVRALTFTSGGLLVTGSDDGTLNLYDVRGSTTPSYSGGLVRKGGGGHVGCCGGHEGWVVSAAARADGRLLASGSSDGSIKLWDLSRSSTAVATLRDAPGDVWALAWKPEGITAAAAQVEGLRTAGLGGGMLVSGAEDGVIRWWRGV